MSRPIGAPSPLRAWLLATRPATLGASVVPVLAGTAIASAEGAFDPTALVGALLGAVLIQIGTNLANDYFDHRKGADGPERLGPARASAAGWLRPEAVRNGAAICFTAAALIGLLLVAKGGWPIAAIGLSGIAAGVAYTGGPYPLGYLGLGELFVVLYFGLAAVGGTAWLHTGRLPPGALWMGAALGLLAAAILAVNNLRDRHSDRAAKKRTLAVRLGAKRTRIEIALLLLVPFGLVGAGAALGQLAPGALLSLLALPSALSRIRRVWVEDGAALNAHLLGTARLLAAFGVLAAIGIAIGPTGPLGITLGTFGRPS